MQASLNNGPAEPLLDDLGLLRHGEDDGEGKALLAGEKTAELLAQSRRQHRDRALDEVDAGSALASIAVESGVGLDEVGHIGDVDTDVVRAVVVDLDGQGIVEILGGVGVDGEDALAAEILANLELSLGDTAYMGSVDTKNNTTHYLRPGDRREALQDILSKVLGGEVAVLQQSTGLDFDVANRSELLDQGTEGMERADGL